MSDFHDNLLFNKTERTDSSRQIILLFICRVNIFNKQNTNLTLNCRFSVVVYSFFQIETCRIVISSPVTCDCHCYFIAQTYITKLTQGNKITRLELFVHNFGKLNLPLEFTANCTVETFIKNFSHQEIKPKSCSRNLIQQSRQSDKPMQALIGLSPPSLSSIDFQITYLQSAYQLGKEKYILDPALDLKYAVTVGSRGPDFHFIKRMSKVRNWNE